MRVPVRYYMPYPPESPLGHRRGVVKADPARTAFILVDAYLPPPPMGADTLSRADYQAKNDIARESIAPALAAARNAGLHIIYVANSAPLIAAERSAFGRHLRTSGSDPLTEFTEETVDPLEYRRGPAQSLVYPELIAPQASDYYIRKHVYSGFYATRLDTLLRNLRIDTLIAVGFRLDACLGLTLMDAHYRNIQVILLRDCTIACDTPEEQVSRAFTKRMVLWHEVLIGPTSTSAQFVAACDRYRDGLEAPETDQGS